MHILGRAAQNRLLTFHDDRPLDLTDVDLTQLLEDIATDARAVQPSRPIDVGGVAPSLTIVADRHQLTQALTTLVTNALRHTPTSAALTVSAAGVGDGEVTIEITDEGPGIPPEHLDHLFDRFYQVDQSLSRPGSGCGLGLSIVKFIVSAHGGSVDVDSRPGEGSTFTVRLPEEPS